MWERHSGTNNSDLILRMFKAIDSHDWVALEDIYHHDAVYERGGYVPFVGVNAIMEFYRTARVLATGEHRLDRIVTEDSCSACWGRFEGRKKNGADVNVMFADVYRVESGKIIFRRSHFFVALV